MFLLQTEATAFSLSEKVSPRLNKYFYVSTVDNHNKTSHQNLSRNQNLSPTCVSAANHPRLTP